MAEDIINLVSSSSSEEEEQYDEDDGADDDKVSSGDDTDSCEEGATDSDADNDGVDDDDGDYGKNNVDDEDSLVDKVIRLLKEVGDLKALNLAECKAYLRKQGLRVTGDKAVCIERICEHWRIKDGNGDQLHPRSRFFINCTGDVCKGDVVLFTQEVPQRVGKPKGTRTVVGKVVKESYGAAKQQHTFTVEVLWSMGARKLPPLYPLLVKGRNLYKMRTFRQPWEDEAKRAQVLAEKHRRGAEARRVREARRVKMISAKGGAGTRKTRGTGKGKHAKRRAHVPLPGQKTLEDQHRVAYQTAQASNFSQWHHILQYLRPVHTAPRPYPYHGQNPYGHREHFNRMAVPFSNQGRFSHNGYAHRPA